MPDWVRRRLERIVQRQNRRRKNPTPEEVRECIDDCDELIRMVRRLWGDRK